MLPEYKDRLILIAEDDPEVRSYLEMAVRCEGYGVETAEDGEEALRFLETGVPIAAVLLDVMMPKRDGLDVLRTIRESGRTLPVIVISGVPAPGVVVEAMRIGATDFLGKPVSHDTLRRVLSGIFGEVEVQPEAQRAPVLRAPQEIFFGSSLAMSELQTMANLVARSETPVLIQGETGSGKEVLACHLHANSARAQRSFVKLNCAALPSELVESELFGYERGAFTGAFERKTGMFEMADGGTLLLDEIGDMDFKLQAKLLQVLQDHEFQRLGGKETVRVDVRVIAATHNDLEKSIAAGCFRQDLYYRLNVVSLHVPPLRERRGDIIPLAAFLLEKYCVAPQPLPEITPALQQAMLLHDWPGNVRELENVIRKLTVIRDVDLVTQDLMAHAARKQHSPALAPGAVEPVAVHTSILDQVTHAKQQAEMEAILAALNTTHWNRKKAAALLNIDYKALLYKMKKLGVDGNPPADPDLIRAAPGNGQTVWPFVRASRHAKPAV
jgi:two-component system response regulator AtoC